jgi:hypothetical protein
MYSYRVWYGNRSIRRESTTSAVRSDGDKRTKFDEFVAPPKYPAPESIDNGGGSDPLRGRGCSGAFSSNLTLRRGATLDSRCGGRPE